MAAVGPRPSPSLRGPLPRTSPQAARSSASPHDSHLPLPALSLQSPPPKQMHRPQSYGKATHSRRFRRPLPTPTNLPLSPRQTPHEVSAAIDREHQKEVRRRESALGRLQENLGLSIETLRLPNDSPRLESAPLPPTSATDTAAAADDLDDAASTTSGPSVGEEPVNHDLPPQILEGPWLPRPERALPLNLSWRGQRSDDPITYRDNGAPHCTPSQSNSPTMSPTSPSSYRANPGSRLSASTSSGYSPQGYQLPSRPRSQRSQQSYASRPPSAHLDALIPTPATTTAVPAPVPAPAPPSATPTPAAPTPVRESYAAEDEPLATAIISVPQDPSLLSPALSSPPTAIPISEPVMSDPILMFNNMAQLQTIVAHADELVEDYPNWRVYRDSMLYAEATPAYAALLNRHVLQQGMSLLDLDEVMGCPGVDGTPGGHRRRRSKKHTGKRSAKPRHAKPKEACLIM